MKVLTSLQKNIAVKRLTAFWALSECGLGGFLHLFKIPFTGLLVGGLAIICIACIFMFSEYKKQLILSLLIVLCIKLSVSPYTPPTAYLSVCFQAVLGYIVYSFFRVNTISFLVVAMLCMLQSALQKLVVLTLFFGKELWQAVDGLFLFITEQLSFMHLSGTKILVISYLCIYILGGIFIAFVFKNILFHFKNNKNEIIVLEKKLVVDIQVKKNGQKRLVKLFVLLAIMAVILLILKDAETTIHKAIYLIVRTSLIVFLWFYVLTPLVGFLLKKGTSNFANTYKQQIAESLQFFPELKQIIKQVWAKTEYLIFIKRLYFFLIWLFVAVITYQTNPKT